MVRSDFTSGDLAYFVIRNIVITNYCDQLKHIGNIRNIRNFSTTFAEC